MITPKTPAELRKGIREGLTLLISECYSKEYSTCELHPIFQPQKFLNKLFPYLHSQGVVIKVEGGLPEYKLDIPDSRFKGKRPSIIFAMGQTRRNNDMVEAGYVAVKPLIKL